MQTVGCILETSRRVRPARNRFPCVLIPIKAAQWGGQENALDGAGKKVVIYTTRRCGYCKKAKAWFSRKGIAYTEYDVENSNKGQRDYKELGGHGVPIILVGEQRLNGFSEDQLGAALRKAGYTL